MENEIKVGEYVRSLVNGGISKVLEISDLLEEPNIKYYKTGKFTGFCSTELYNVKHSPNLKDLIQKDDFVNGDRVVAIDYTEDENGNYVDVLGIMEIDDDYAYPIELRVINIQEVVTKEMMEAITYKVTEM